MITYTPKPWIAHSNGDITTEDGTTIASVYDNPGEEQGEFNIGLVRTAPELLEVLEMALKESGCDGDLCAHH